MTKLEEMTSLSLKQMLAFFSIVALIAVIAFGVFCMYFAMNTASARDHDDASAVASAIDYPFPKLLHPNTDGRPALYVRPHPRRTEIIIYSVLDLSQQDDIISMIRKGQEKVPNKPVIVTFLEREEWERSWGAGFQRGKEKTIRSLTIKGQRR